jgi:hypothetical protein
MGDLKWKGVETSGTYFRDYLHSPYSFEETVARLVTLSEQPIESPDGEKVSVEFTGTFKGQVFTLYDYKEDREMHIGGHSHLAVEGLDLVLQQELASTHPTPYTAKEYYDTQEGHQWPT